MRVNENSSVVAGVISVIKLTNRDRLLPSIERVKYDEISSIFCVPAGVDENIYSRVRVQNIWPWLHEGK